MEGLHMLKRFIYILFLIGTLFFLVSCSANEDQVESGTPEEDSESTMLLGELPERKIIYSVNLSIYTKDLEESIKTLKSNVNADEWFDYENIRETQASFTIRIKSDRLDEFIESIDDSFDVSSYSKTGRDISLQYLDTTNKIAALEAQYDRLVLLYEDASLSDMITINTRLGEIETELLALQGTLNTFDSLVDYSEVSLTIYQTGISSKDPFFNRLFSAFGNGITGVIVFFDGLLIAIFTVLPFAIIFIPSGYGVYILVKKYKLNKKSKKPKE
jgi:hypothetical protein